MKKDNPSAGKFQRLRATLCLICMVPISGAMANCPGSMKLSNESITTQETKSSEKFLGGLSPDEALVYMKTTPDLYIIDVREPEWYEGYTQFTNNIHIPYSKLAERYKEIPTDRPVILNCGMGMVAPRAYKLLKELNMNVMQLSYIAGPPQFQEYNEWVSKQNR